MSKVEAPEEGQHIYVLYTMSGQEEIIERILRKTVLRMPDEFLFAPTACYHMRIRQEDRIIERRLYPGYIFLNTAEPVSFYNRLMEARFFASFGKYLRVLKNDSPLPAAGGAADGVSWTRQPEELYRDCVARISDEEEETVLSLCGMERREDGEIVRRAKKRISIQEIRRLEQAGVDIASLRLETEADAAAEYAEAAEHAEAAGQGLAADRDKPDAASPFRVEMSHGIKVIRHGSHAGHRKPQDIRTVILDGPLQGMEGQIVKVDEHRRIATVRTTLMHRKIDIQVPLAIVKRIEE